MKTLLNLITVLVTTTGIALAGSHGNSATSHPRNGCAPTHPNFQNSFNHANHRHASTHQAHRVPGQNAAFVIVDIGQNACTVQEDTLYGQSAPMDPAGVDNYLTSLAHMNELQAQRLANENQRRNAESQLRLRKAQAELRAAEKEERMALARERNAARPRAVPSEKLVLSPSGTIAWPTFFQAENYSDYRTKVNQVLQEKALTSHVSDADRQQIAEMTDQILEELKANIQNIRPQDYVAAKSFARGLLAELQSQPSPNDRSRAGDVEAQTEPAGQ
jgi:transcription initiation factor TFIIIB Brf1 subunit/transcription initiation factor TFIIB